MDANKEESDRCVLIAQRCLREGNRLKALKFLQKAQKMCPTSKKVRELLNECRDDDDDEEDDEDDDEDEPSQNGYTIFGNNYSAFDQYESNVRSRFHGSKSQPDFTKQPSTASSESTSSSSGSTSPTSDESNSSINNNNSTGKRSKSRTRTPSTSSANGNYHRTPSSPQLGAEYTQEQLESVQRVRHCKDYYEMLNVKKDVSEIDLKKHYKKLALQFHPDKNRAPGATEAFKAIGNAYAVLIDSEKRQRYDMYGTDTPTTVRRRNTFYEYDYSRGFEADMTAEEIFSMFFGQGFSQDMHRRQHFNFTHQSTDGEQGNENAVSALFLLLPVIILVVMSVFSQFLMPEAAYSLHRTETYNHERRTSELGLAYFVKEDFVKQFSGNIYRIDQQIDQDYVQQLKTNCLRERSHRETMIWRAKNYGDAELYENAQGLRTPSCDRLTEIYS